MLDTQVLQGHLMARFHRRGRVDSRFYRPKWAWAILSRTRLAVPLGYWDAGKGCRQVVATHVVRWLVDRIVLPWDRGIITNIHIIREVIVDNGGRLFYWRKCCRKVCRPTLSVLQQSHTQPLTMNRDLKTEVFTEPWLLCTVSPLICRLCSIIK